MSGTRLNEPDGIDEHATTLHIYANSALPLAPFHLTFESGETVKVTAGGPRVDTLTVQRGALGTTRVGHSNGERLIVSVDREVTLALEGSGTSLPGVTSDGLTPGGIVVVGALTAGDINRSDQGDWHFLYGSTALTESVGNQVDVDDVVEVQMGQALVGDSSVHGINAIRAGALNGHQYLVPFIELNDVTATTAPVLQVTKQGVAVLELTTQKSITGALASVTDAATKAVLTSIIAALTGIKVATNDTT